MDSFSESHAVLRMANGAAIRDDDSRAGTEVDGEPLGRQERALADGATIGFAHGTLRLQARCEPGHWARLERLPYVPTSRHTAPA